MQLATPPPQPPGAHPPLQQQPGLAPPPPEIHTCCISRCSSGQASRATLRAMKAPPPITTSRATSRSVRSSTAGRASVRSTTCTQTAAAAVTSDHHNAVNDRVHRMPAGMVISWQQAL